MLKDVALRFSYLNLGATGVFTPQYRISLIALLLLLLVPAECISQQAEPQEEVLRVSTDLVVFPVRINDKKRNNLPGLTDRDLIFKDDDHVTTAPYLSFGAERVAMVFALDASGSLREIISVQRDAALGLFRRFKQESRIAVVHFAEKPQVIASFDTDVDEAGEAFNFPAERNHRTAIFDAAAAAVKTLAQLPYDPAERRVVVLLSDGLDNASSRSASAAIETARANNISIYIVHLPLFEPRDGRLAVRTPSKGFRELAERSGGKYFLVGAKASLGASEPPDLTPIFQAIADDIKSQYLVGFYVGETAHDGRTHRVSIALRPSGLSYSFANEGYSRTHDFFVNLTPPKGTKPSQ